MRALTNGEGEEEEVVASAGAAPGLGRKRRRAEQRGAQRARAAEARGAGRGGRGLRHDPHAQPGRATLRSSAQAVAPAAKAARRSPSPTVKVVSFVDSPVGGAEGRMTPRHVLTFLVIVIGPTSPTQRLTRRCQSPQAQDLPGRHVPPALPVSPVLTRLLVRSLVSLLAQGPGPVPRPTAPLLSATALQAGRATRARIGRRRRRGRPKEEARTARARARSRKARGSRIRRRGSWGAPPPCE